MTNGRLSVYEIDYTPLSTTPVLAQRWAVWSIQLRTKIYNYVYMYKKIQKNHKINYKKKEKLSWKMALPPDESLTSKWTEPL